MTKKKTWKSLTIVLWLSSRKDWGETPLWFKRSDALNYNTFWVGPVCLAFGRD
jgi:sugar lactone lactonase YvrE